MTDVPKRELSAVLLHRLIRIIHKEQFMLDEYDGFESNEDFGVELKENGDEDLMHAQVAK